MFSCRQSTCKLSPRTRNRSPGLLAVAKLPQDFWMESNFPNGQGVVLASPLGQGDSPGPDDPSSLRPSGLRRSGTLRQDGRRPHSHLLLPTSGRHRNIYSVFLRYSWENYYFCEFCESCLKTEIYLRHWEF